MAQALRRRMIMASLRFSSFGAATMPLSKIVIDKTLDMGDYALVGKNIVGPYRPYTWETEPFPYNDRSSRNVVEGVIDRRVFADEALVGRWTCDSPNPCYVRAIIPIHAGWYDAKNVRIAINGVTVYSTGKVTAGKTVNFSTVIWPGDVFEVYASSTNDYTGTRIDNALIVDTGFEAPVNLDLQGRFLALQDFGDLTATLTFGDEENVPFTEYPNRFPCAPDKITINAQKVEDRPVINVYKGV